MSFLDIVYSRTVSPFLRNAFSQGVFSVFLGILPQSRSTRRIFLAIVDSNAPRFLNRRAKHGKFCASNVLFGHKQPRKTRERMPAGRPSEMPPDRQRRASSPPAGNGQKKMADTLLSVPAICFICPKGDVPVFCRMPYRPCSKREAHKTPEKRLKKVLLQRLPLLSPICTRYACSDASHG